MSQTVELPWRKIIVQRPDDVLHGIPGHGEASSTELGQEEPAHAQVDWQEMDQVHPAQLHDEGVDRLPGDPEIACQLTRMDTGLPIECFEAQVQGRREAELLQPTVDRVREPLFEAADGSEQGRCVERWFFAGLRVHTS